MARLDQARLIDAFTPLRDETGRFALGCYLLELFDRVAPEGGVRADMRRMFGFALAALRTLSTRAPDLRFRTLLELRALDAVGLCPELAHCVRCASPLVGAGPFHFHVADGGVVCGSCIRDFEDVLSIHAGTLRALHQALRFDLERLDRLAMGSEALREARRVLGRFQRFHLGVELRSERFLDQVLRSPQQR